MMFNHMKLQTKLLTIGLLLSVIPLLIILTVVLRQNRMMNKTSSEECLKLAVSGLDPLVHGVYAMCTTQEQTSQQMINSDLNVARRILDSAGQVNFSPDEVSSWKAINQYTQEAIIVDLPKMKLGDAWLGQNTDMHTPSLVVDEVKRMMDSTCTIFQRMNDAGDMLRVCTNVQKEDGSRAIGTYIPAINPDGELNPVIASILQGKPFQGRAFVVNAWYITAYEPVFDSSRNVIGVLYVGIPEERVIAGLKQEIKKLKIGKTGYVYVFDSKGNYLVSQDGLRDGENIWEARDENNNFMVQDICAKALALSPDQIAEHRYLWKNQGNSAAGWKIARIMYFKPWDWIIGAGANEDEILESRNKIDAIGSRSKSLVVLIAFLAFVGTVLIWIFVARGLAGKLSRVVEQLTGNAEQTSSASGQVAQASQVLAEGANEQAASLEEISSSLEEVSSMTRQNADYARQATLMSNQARDAAEKSREVMGKMSEAIVKIKDSSDETGKIIKTIDEIAFQTNLLALNAAVEAAHAGDAGRGFAVVAEEVRNLAQRCAEAAQNTAALIDGSRENTQNGVDASREVGEVLNQVSDAIRKVTQLVSDVSTASDAQAQGIEQVNIAMSQIDKVMQQNTANAEQSASAGEELSAQAEELTHMAGILMSIVGGDGRSLARQAIRSLARKKGRLAETAQTNSSLADRLVLHSLPLKK